MPHEVARAREQELRSGDLLVFTQEMAFPGVLWNNEMSNRVEFLEFKTADQFVADLELRQP
jgi:hypothetical protein